MLSIVGDARYPPAVHRRALAIVRVLAGQLGVLSGAYQRQVSRRFVLYVVAVLPVLCCVWVLA